jgi:hypothetical protein
MRSTRKPFFFQAWLSFYHLTIGIVGNPHRRQVANPASGLHGLWLPWPVLRGEVIAPLRCHQRWIHFFFVHGPGPGPGPGPDHALPVKSSAAHWLWPVKLNMVQVEKMRVLMPMGVPTTSQRNCSISCVTPNWELHRMSKDSGAETVVNSMAGGRKAAARPQG